MKRQSYDVTVIGAGPNGLICSAYLAKAGLKVALLERRHETGGGLDTLEFGGFKFNPHAVYHLMAEVMPAYTDLDLRSKGLRYIFPEVQAAYLTEGRPPLLFYHDPMRTIDHISRAYSPREGEKYRRMYFDFKDFSEKILMPLTYVPPMPAMDQFLSLERAADDVGKRFNSIADLTAVEILDRYGLEEPLKAALLNLFVMWGLSPFETIGYLLPLYIYRMTNAALCVGGSHRLSSALHKVLVKAGGAVLDSSEVRRVKLSNGKACGVVLSDGSEIDAQAVVSTLDPRQSFLEFFEEGQLPETVRESARRWEWETSTFFGVHAALKEAPRYAAAEGNMDANRAMITFLGVRDTDQLLDHMEELSAGKLPSHFLGHTTCASLFDPLQACEGFHTGRWESLVPFDCDWEKIKDDYAHQCLDAWRRQAPNLETLHIMAYPPTYIEQKLKNMVRGSFKHGAYLPLQMGYFRPNDVCSRTYTPLAGYYVCGASVYPGGMILGGGGYIGANIIADDFGVKKTWEEPEMVKQARAAGFIGE
ncbi:MAG: phytoene desaturase family protein [Thermodesulfobacteriota bacterium]